MNYENRQYLILPIIELDKINFNEVLETSINTIRTSTDGTKTFIKWNGDIPSSVQNILNPEGPYTHNEILEILSTEEWTQLFTEPTE